MLVTQSFVFLSTQHGGTTVRVGLFNFSSCSHLFLAYNCYRAAAFTAMKIGVKFQEKEANSGIFVFGGLRVIFLALSTLV